MEEDYKEMFLAEAKEHMDSLNNLLVELEKNKEDSAAINNIFRSFHTLKGNSATMGYEAFSKLAHKLEDLLDLVRNKKLEVDPNVMDILFKGCDALEDGLNKIEKNAPESIEAQDIIEKIESIAPSANKEGKSAREITDKVVLSDDEKRLSEGLEIQKVKRIVIEFEDSPLKAPKALSIIKKIEDNKANKIIRLNPKKSSIEASLDKKLEIIVYTDNPRQIDESIKRVSKIKNYRFFSLDESYAEHAKELNKADIIKSHNEELKKVQEVKIDIKRLDNLMDMVGELLIHKMRLEAINRNLQSKDLEEITNSISILTQNIQSEVIEERMIPVGSVFSRLPRIVRDLSREEGKDIEFLMEGEDQRLDRTVIEKITDPLVHMIRNSVDHGIESPDERVNSGKEKKGLIQLRAKREKNSIVIEVEDDGAGIDPQKVKEVALKRGVLSPEALNNLSDEKILDLVFLPGFSTSEKITEVSGRGVGLDVVSTNLKQVGGKVFLDTKKGKGTKLRLELPLTVAIISVLLVNIDKERYAIPLNNVEEIIDIKKEDIKTLENRETFILRGQDVPLLRLKTLLGLHFSEDDKLIVIIVEDRNQKIGIIVDSIESQQQTLIKSVDERIKKIRGIAGGTILGDGKVCFILDIDSLVDGK